MAVRAAFPAAGRGVQSRSELPLWPFLNDNGQVEAWPLSCLRHRRTFNLERRRGINGRLRPQRLDYFAGYLGRFLAIREPQRWRISAGRM